ncbi:DUF397 domain-containing protein [Phytohabitans kaempferiae]|uniref:DUF397 domain-containing protein n=1 Tax=Phytohabitans kaempferiae TaxID=1620943 RepID=A0ABV6M3Q1_9ACTN
MADTERLDWQKSGQCDSSTCVEIARRGDRVVLRDGKDPDGPWLVFSVREWSAFLAWTRQCAR